MLHVEEEEQSWRIPPVVVRYCRSLGNREVTTGNRNLTGLKVASHVELC